MCDIVFMRLQPYRKSTLRESGLEILKPFFYGPIRVSERIGEVAYELELFASSKMHNVFHVSSLKKERRHNVVPSLDFPPLDEGKLILIPKAIIDYKEHSLWRRIIKEYLAILG